MLCFGFCFCFRYPLTPIRLSYTPGCGATLWRMGDLSATTSIEKTGSSSPRSHPMPSIWGRGSWTPLDTMLEGWVVCVILCRWPQLLWVHQWNSPVMSTRPQFVPVVQLLAFVPLPWDGPWAFSGWYNTIIPLTLKLLSWPVGSFCISHHPLLIEKSLMWLTYE